MFTDARKSPKLFSRVGLGYFLLLDHFGTQGRLGWLFPENCSLLGSSMLRPWVGSFDWLQIWKCAQAAATKPTASAPFSSCHLLPSHAPFAGTSTTGSKSFGQYLLGSTFSRHITSRMPAWESDHVPLSDKPPWPLARWKFHDRSEPGQAPACRGISWCRRCNAWSTGECWHPSHRQRASRFLLRSIVGSWFWPYRSSCLFEGCAWCRVWSRELCCFRQPGRRARDWAWSRSSATDGRGSEAAPDRSMACWLSHAASSGSPSGSWTRRKS